MPVILPEQNIMMGTEWSYQQQVVRPKRTTHGPFVRAHDMSHLTQYSIELNVLLYYLKAKCTDRCKKVCR